MTEPAPPSPERFASRGELAYAKVREAIQVGRLAPGSRVREAEIAEWLEISRTPVREAMRRLEADGLLTFEPHRGMVVARLDQQAVTELYSMRETLEAMAAERAAQHASDAEIEALGDLLVHQPPPDGDPAVLAEHNRRFHNAIFRAAHNRYLLKSMRSIGDAMTLLGPTTLALPDRSAAALAEHRRLFEAVQQRAAGAAANIAREHIRAAHRARLALLFENGFVES